MSGPWPYITSDSQSFVQVSRKVEEIAEEGLSTRLFVAPLLTRFSREHVYADVGQPLAAFLTVSPESLPRPFVESPSPPAVFCGGRRWRSRMREASHSAATILRCHTYE